jgi:hypothetical protein
MADRTVCYMHGGKTPRGYGLPQTTSGRYSKILPLRLQTRYSEAIANPRLLSLHDDVGVCEARLAELFARLDSHESGTYWETLRETLEAFDAARASNQGAAMEAHLTTLRTLITAGGDEFHAWAEIQALWETRAKLTQTETKTLLTMQQMVSTEQLMLMFGVITQAIHDAVTAHAPPDVSRKILDVLGGEFQRISLLEEARGA